MKITRKEFLELSGACLVALSGRKVLAVLGNAGPSQAEPASGTAARKQWGMIIDTKKCAKEQGCTRCIEACNRTHNIPSFQDPRHRIEWIWEQPFEDLFPSYQTQYLENARKEEPTPVLCNHCDDPPCVRVCPTSAT
jgi:[DsrC]-trisulfide reductase subunit O